MNRCRLIFVLAIFLAAPSFGAADPEFHAVVRSIETQYGVHHLRIPFGLATLCLKIAQVPGASGLKIAVFNNFSQAEIPSDGEFEESIESTMGSGWLPVVRVRSNHDLTLIYANPSDKDIRALIVCLQSHVATVVQTKVTASQLRKWIEQPDEATHQMN